MYKEKVACDFKEVIELKGRKVYDLRYGENPNQPAAAYSFGGSGLNELKTGKNGMSATNLMDIYRALDILQYFSKPSVVVMKHLIPSGFATDCGKLSEVYTSARDADARSAFGSVVVTNTRIDKETAEEMSSSYIEVVAAPSFDEEAFSILSKKKNIRLIEHTGIKEHDIDIKMLPGGTAIVQKPFVSKVSFEADTQEKKDLLTAWYVNTGVRSNGIVIVKNGVTLAIGSGQQERVGAVEQAIMKAYQKALDRAGVSYEPLHVMDNIDQISNPLEGAVLSSDGFFPFRDSIDLIAKYGITSVIQPGGSMRDDEVLEAAKEHNITMTLTKERCFGHF